MTDTASLVARVKAEGADASARQLDAFADAATRAEQASEGVTDAVKKAPPALSNFAAVAEQLGNRLAIMEEAQLGGARAATVLAAQLRLSEGASQSQIAVVGELAGKLYDAADAETAAANAAAVAARKESEAAAGRAKAASIVTQLEQQLKLLRVAEEKGAAAAAALANQFKAGTGATDEQKARISSLTAEIGAFSGAVETKGKGGLGTFRNAAQQTGYQVQDLVVQLQSGTSAFVAIGQQGSQLAGAFGPGGAVIGAIIALAAAAGGVLVKAFGGAKVSAEELQTSGKQLDEVLQRNKDGTYELSDSFVTLANNIGTASEAQAQFYQAQAATVTQTEGAKEAIKGLVDGLDSWLYGSAIGAQSTMALGQEADSLTGYIKTLADDFGITKDEAAGLVPLLAAVQKNASPENVKALSDETARLNDQYNGTNSELVKFNGELFKNVGAMQQAQSQSDVLARSQDNLSAATNAATNRIKEQNAAIIKNIQIGNLADKDRYAAQAQADKEAFAKREGATKEDIAAYNAARDEQARQDIQRVTDSENKKAEAEAKAEAKRGASAAKREENKAAQAERQAKNFLDTLDRQNSDEIAAITATEQQKLAKVQEFQQAGAITVQQAEDAKTKIILEADIARQEELDKRQKDQTKKQAAADSFLAQIQAQNGSELEQFDRQQEIKLQKLTEFHAAGLIAEKQFQAAKDDIAQQGLIKASQYSAQQFSSILGDMSAAMKEGSREAKALAVAQAIAQTYLSAVSAYQSASAIPVVGWLMGPIAAAAAVAAGMANVQKIRSAREQGGALARGQASTIAERGKAEVILPAGASRVRTAQQMAQIMGENRRGSGSDSVTIVNNTTGRIDSATTERDDEGRLRVIISETVSQALQDSNSDISKSRRSTRGQPGY